MPEGHVIHRLARQLNATFRPDPLEVCSPQGRFATEAALLDGQPLDLAEAWGKHLFLHIGGMVVHIHLGLIGTFRITERTDTDDPGSTTRLLLRTDTHEARLIGPQWCRLIAPDDLDAAVARLGADPLRAGDPATAERFARVQQRLGRTSRSLASVLMDQTLWAGVGNIYRAEVLFRLGLRPDIPAREVSAATWQQVWEDMVELMADGEARGRIDTVAPAHTPEAMGRPPRVDDHGGEVYVYRRTGQPCYVCGTPIVQSALEGRSLYHCPSCQTHRRAQTARLQP